MTSELTGYTQQIASGFSYWAGDLLFPPITGEKVRQWRHWLAKLQQDPDPSVWIPVDVERWGNQSLKLDCESDLTQTIDEFEIQVRFSQSTRNTNNHDEFQLELIYPDPRPDGIARLAMRERFAEFGEKYLSDGEIMQFQGSTDNTDIPTSVSYLRTITSCGFDDSGTRLYTCLDTQLNRSGNDSSNKFYGYDIEYGNPKVRAQLLGSDIMGLSYDRNAIANPTRIPWVEAVGAVARDYEDARNP